MRQNLWQRLFTRHQTKQAVLVLGSGRSGTSVMTKCLNLMGISLGTDNLLAPSKRINPKGYFENKDVIRIHKALGGKLRYRPAFQGYYDSPKVKADRAVLTTYLTGFFENERYLAIKDPRMNDYIQLWQHVLADIDVAPAEIILLRNPLDVVDSNARAWHRDTTLAMRQWQVRTLLSLRDTLPQSRILVTYEDLFDQPLATLKRIATKFDLPWPEDEGLLQAQLDDFIDPALQTSDSGESLSDFEARSDVAPDVKALYRLGRQAAADEDFFASTDFQMRINDLTEAYLKDYGPLYRDFNAKIPGQTFFVYGQEPEDVTAVQRLLATQEVEFAAPDGPSHPLALDLGDQLADGTLQVATYDHDYRATEEKEDLNNYLRRNAKRYSRWGVADTANQEIVEMLTTVSAELGTDARNVVIAPDLTASDEPKLQRERVQHLVRTLRALAHTRYLVVMADELDQSGTSAAVQAFASVKPPRAAPVQSDQADEALQLRTPLDWAETATILTELCRQASADPREQATLNHFINLNANEILTTKGDQYANSLRN